MTRGGRINHDKKRQTCLVESISFQENNIHHPNAFVPCHCEGVYAPAPVDGSHPGGLIFGQSPRQPNLMYRPFLPSKENNSFMSITCCKNN